MNKQRHVVFALLVLLVGGIAANLIILSTSGSTNGVPLFMPYATATYSPALAADITSGECLKSFSAFAYEPPPKRNFDKRLPPPSWQNEAAIPLHGIEGYTEHYGNFDAVLSRSVAGHTEIWLNGELWGEDFETNAKPVVIIYKPDLQTWEFLSARIGDTGLVVDELFRMDDGSVWGRVTWDYFEPQTLTKFPVLSRFNEKLRRFEFAEGALEIPVIVEQNHFDMTKIVLDKQQNFWIFVENDGIYRYDPDTATSEKITDFKGIPAYETTVAPDGSIYFVRDKNAWGMSLRLSDLELLRLIPETGEITPVELPDEETRPFGGMLFDHIGRLWLGSIAYRDMDNAWHFIYPPAYARRYFNGEGYGHYIWALPHLILESSDGRLWYQKYVDTGGWVDGTAWYNPETNEGCMFTNVAANIIEDGQRQLWLVADGKLYKHVLN